MKVPSIQPVRDAFASLPSVQEWLRPDLHPMDRADGEDFLASVATGEDPAEYFQSAIPYIAILADPARVHFLPDILETLQKHHTSIFEIAAQFDGDTGARLARSLTDVQKGAVRRYLDALLQDRGLASYRDEFASFRGIFQ